MPPTPVDDKERLVLDDIQRHGWSIIYVFDEEEVEPPFAYSVGFAATLGHPEIIIFGMTDALANPVINTLGDRIRDTGIQYESGRFYDGILENHRCYMHAPPEGCFADYVGWDLWFYEGYNFSLLQCIYPCERGLFPWDPDAPPLLRAYQPILGGFQRH